MEQLQLKREKIFKLSNRMDISIFKDPRPLKQQSHK